VGARVLNGRFALAANPLEGGSAVVYKASDLEAEMRHVAVKVFGENHGQSRFMTEFFSRECRALQELRHPGIIDLLDWGIDEETGNRFLVLEWMEDTLSSRRGDAFEGWDSFYEDLGRPILEALSFAHGRGVWHRDLKPANILLDELGRPKIADFSIAKVDERWDPAHTVGAFGSRPYTAPEADDGSASSGRDCWSFAVVCLHCLTELELRTDGDVSRALADADIPQPVADLFERCLSTTPQLRPATATVLLAEIDRIQAERDASAIRRRRVHLAIGRERVEILEQAVGASTRGELEKAIVADLQDAAFQPYVDRGQEAKAGHFRLLGTEFTYHVAVDGQEKDRLRVINAARASVVALEERRERAFQPYVEFTFAEPQRPQEAQAQLESIRDELDEFLAEKAVQQQVREGQEVFKRWRGILQLKSDLQRKQSAPARYKSFERAGRDRITFHLATDAGGVEPDEVRVVSLPHETRAALRGEVENVSGRRVTLFVTEGDYESLPLRGELRLDMYAAQIAVDRQKNAVDAVQYGRSVRGDLGSLLINPEASRRPQPPTTLSLVHDQLDEAKQDAVSRAVGAPDILTVEGPPGTGKTLFIAEVVLQTLKANPAARILIASQTHVALDNAMERVGQRTPDLPMIRVGRIETGKVDPAVERWLVDQQLAEWRQRVVGRSRAFIDRWSQDHGLSAVDVQNASSLEQVAALQGEIAKVQVRIEALQASPALEPVEPVSTEGVQEEAAREHAATERTEISDELDAARRELRALQQQRKPLLERLVAKDFARNERELRAMSPEELRERATALLANTGPEVEQLRRLLEIHSEWVQRFGRSYEFRAALIARANVVGATCVGFAGAAGTAESEFDLCILDEASRATPTEALVPMARGRRWILVGDPRQLPPFVDDAIQHDAALSDHGLTRDQLENTLFDRLLALLPDECQSSLTIQHRMAPPIGTLISDCFYEGRLRNGRGDSPNPYELVLPKRVTWITTTGLEDAREVRAGTSVSNEAEVRVIRKLLGHLDFVAGGKGLRQSVVVLAGYANQCERLERAVAALAPALKNIEIDVHTVDSFQGREANVAIYSVTRSNDARKLGFLGDERRLNVALSRGQEVLVIVGDHDFCRTAVGENPLKPVLEHVERNGSVCEVKDARSL
jgi:hypothetical protein